MSVTTGDELGKSNVFLKVAMALMPLGIKDDRCSPLLQEYTMLFCCEQAFDGAVEAFHRVCIRWILMIAQPKMWLPDGSETTNPIQNLPKEKRAEVESACGYFTAHAHRLKYDDYLAAGLPIANGVIERVCRHLVKDRLERTGMRWSTSGAQAMLNRRSLKASNAWDEFQKHFLNQSPLNA